MDEAAPSAEGDPGTEESPLLSAEPCNCVTEGSMGMSSAESPYDVHCLGLSKVKVESRFCGEIRGGTWEPLWNGPGWGECGP